MVGLQVQTELQRQVLVVMAEVGHLVEVQVVVVLPKQSEVLVIQWQVITAMFKVQDFGVMVVQEVASVVVQVEKELMVQLVEVEVVVAVVEVLAVLRLTLQLI